MRKRRRKDYEPSGLTLFLAFIIVVVLAVIGGYFLSGFIGSLLWPENQAVFNPQDDETYGDFDHGTWEGSDFGVPADSLVLPGLELIRLQVNAFNDKNNAVKFAEQLIEDGFTAEVFYITPYYRVISGFYHTEAAAKADAELLDRAGYEIYLAPFVLEDRVLSTEDENVRVYLQEVCDHLSQYPAMIVEFTAVLDSLVLDELDKERAQEEIASISESLAAVMGGISTVDPPEGLQEAHETIGVSLRSLRGAILNAELYLERSEISAYLLARGRVMQAVKTYELFGQNLE